MGGVADHVHLLAKLSPTIAISDMLRLIKTNTSKMVNENNKPKHPFEWQTGYGAFSVSESRHEAVRKYILNQEEHHRKRTLEEEFIELLQKHNIEYDQRYVFTYLTRRLFSKNDIVGSRTAPSIVSRKAINAFSRKAANRFSRKAAT